MRHGLVLFALVVLMFSGVVTAQPVETFAYPKVLTWAPIIPTGWDNTDPYMRPTIYVECYDSNNHAARDAAVVAQEAATAIINYRGNYTAAERPICLFIKNLSRDEPDHDYNRNSPYEPRHWEYAVRIARVEDRLPYPNTTTPRYDDWLLVPNAVPEMPNGWAPISSARWCRHPFLINGTAASPMKAWMQDFVVALKEALPSTITPERFYIDSEPVTAFTINTSATLMLKKLMTEYNTSATSIWTRTSMAREFQSIETTRPSATNPVAEGLWSSRPMDSHGVSRFTARRPRRASTIAVGSARVR
jgi:hypothetical protein